MRTPHSRSLRHALPALIAAALGATSPCAQADPGGVQARLQRLEVEVIRAEDSSAIRKLQRAYGFYADRGLWSDLADLFTEDATADYPSGIFLGKASIRGLFFQDLGAGRLGLADGRLYNHTILQPVITLSPDGATATGRWRVLGMLGRFGGTASWAGGLYRFDYVKEHGVWKIRSLISYSDYGGRYDVGWALPRADTRLDTSAIKFNLPHPADRPRQQPCDDDATVCVAPFPYANPGTAVALNAPVAAVGAGHAGPTTAQDAGAQAAQLLARVQRLAAEQAVTNLQFAYGYYLDRGLWAQAASLFAPQGSLEQGLQGVYVGRNHIRRFLQSSAPQGLTAGDLNDHLQLEPIIDVASDGLSAKGRIFELALLGNGSRGTLMQSVEENRYVRRNGTWMIAGVHDYTTMVTDALAGWGKDAQPAASVSSALPPDHPPTAVYEVYPKVYTPPLHFANPATGKPTQYAADATRPADPAAASLPEASKSEVPQRSAGAQMVEAERELRRVQAYDAIENLQDAYGYYMDKALWQDVALLFAKDGSLQIADSAVAVGPDHILAFLRASGPEGPQKDVLNDQLQLQPLIDVAADGRTAKVRSRLLRQGRAPDGRALWGAGLYENELVNVDGVWKFTKLRLYPMFTVDYTRGWARGGLATGDELLPSPDTPPFHYSNPVTGP